MTSIIILPIIFGEENSHDIVNNNHQSRLTTILSNKYTQQELDDRTAINEFIPTDGYNS